MAGGLCRVVGQEIRTLIPLRSTRALKKPWVEIREVWHLTCTWNGIRASAELCLTSRKQ
jgi:hypothetical protein